MASPPLSPSPLPSVLGLLGGLTVVALCLGAAAVFGLPGGGAGRLFAPTPTPDLRAQLTSDLDGYSAVWRQHCINQWGEKICPGNPAAEFLWQNAKSAHLADRQLLADYLDWAYRLKEGEARQRGARLVIVDLEELHQPAMIDRFLRARP